ncbi:MAG: hypothetical protein CMC31_06120 [Flavobacteriaceae bacterium]|nr:hypothetical protein [Flavobacteriaceae bacterium]
MKNYAFYILLLTFSNLFSQNDLKVEQLLDKVSFNIDQSTSYSLNFSYIIDDDIAQKRKGNIIISKNKYILEFLGVKQISDSNFIYTIVPENQEVMISKIQKEAEENISPSNILKFYRQGYEIEMDQLKVESGLSIQFLKLTPNFSDSEISHIFLGININNNNIYKVIEIGKNNSNTMLKIENISYNLKINEDAFDFKEDDYEGYYIEKI